MSLITVIVPIYNTEVYLDRCITSIIGQTLQDIEILLINDGSTDNSLEILLKYANKDDRIKIINQNNKGLSATRNVGIGLAGSAYILHVDSDDWIEPDMCKALYEKACQYNADIVISHMYFDYSNKTIIKKEPYKKITNRNDFLLTFVTKKGINSLCNKLIKRDLYILNNIKHYEEISLGEDSSALLRLVVFAPVIISVDRAFYHYDIKMLSMTGNRQKKVMEYIYALSKVEKFFVENNIETKIFPLLKLKIAYINLYKNMNSAVTDEYKKLRKHFYIDMKSIISHVHFPQLCFKYKCFALICFLFKRFLEEKGDV